MLGNVAPDFTLENSRGKMVTLSQLVKEKNVILVFYPKDFTPGCTRQLSELRDNYSRVERANAIVVGVSPDNADSHKRFIDRYKFPFELLTDLDLKVAGLFDCVKEDLSGIRRTVVGIAKDRRIVFFERGMPSPSEVLKPLRRANRELLKKGKMR